MNNQLFIFLYIMLVFVIPVSTMVGAYNERALIKKLTEKGISADARIVSVSQDKTGYLVKYVFSIQKAEYFNNQVIPAKKYEELISLLSNQGFSSGYKHQPDELKQTLVKATYLENEPKVSRLLESVDDNEFRQKVIFSAVIFIVFSVGYSFLIK